MKIGTGTVHVHTAGETSNTGICSIWLCVYTVYVYVCVHVLMLYLLSTCISLYNKNIASCWSRSCLENGRNMPVGYYIKQNCII